MLRSVIVPTLVFIVSGFVAASLPAHAKDRDHVEVLHVSAKYDAQANILKLHVTLPAGKVIRRTIVGDRAIDRTLKILEIAGNDNARLYVDVRNEKPKDLTVEFGKPVADVSSGNPKFRDGAGR